MYLKIMAFFGAMSLGFLIGITILYPAIKFLKERFLKVSLKNARDPNIAYRNCAQMMHALDDLRRAKEYDAHNPKTASTEFNKTHTVQKEG